MIPASAGKGGGLHLGRPAHQITLRDIYGAVTEDKRVFVAREDLPARCRISASINEFFDGVTEEAESAMLEVLSRRNVAVALEEILCLNARAKRAGRKIWQSAL